GNGEPAGERDPLYDQAVEIVLRTRRPSISLVQRHLRIGYNRAARLIQDMERSGVLSPMQSNGNREVLVPAKAERPRAMRVLLLLALRAASSVQAAAIERFKRFVGTTQSARAEIEKKVFDR